MNKFPVINFRFSNFAYLLLLLHEYKKQMKRIFILLLAVACLTSASNDGFKKTASGLKYKIYTKIEGKKAQIGEIIKFNMIVRTSADSLIDNSYKSGQPYYQIKVEKSNFPGDFMEGLKLLTKGDSATILVSSDSIPSANCPPFLRKPGSYLRFDVKIVDIESEEQFNAEQAKNSSKQNEIDDKLIQDWLKNKGLTAKKTSSGLYYVMDKVGTGAQAKAGDKVSVNYTGYLLNGKKFDSSRDRGQPFSFDLGKGQVIKGWDEGIALFNVGSSGKIIIPSALGYGTHGAGGDIPANAVLVFDIELMGIQ